MDYLRKQMVLSNEMILAKAKVFLDNAFNSGVTHQLEIRPYKVNRSTQQNQYYWKIITIIADEVGCTKDDMHKEYKHMFLLPILHRDNKHFADLMAKVGNDYEDRKNIARIVSTTKLNTKQFSEYLDDVTHHAISLGIRLPQEGV